MALEALSSFEEWLEKHGAELRGAHIRLSADNPEWGLGVYTAQHEPSADDGVLCRIPLAGLALTVQTCLEDPQLGDFFGGLLAEGEGDGRLCLMLFLVVHKALGPRSAWAPYPHIPRFVWIWVRGMGLIRSLFENTNVVESM
ncbi:hypothetical protein KFL_003390130 [Klebsormidium nitens]|uniref:Uncharacterized protein n=1 Tax=Klebsormidium nitens TaxID=105231 RepID=A0A1Y1I9J0_KLENI|nr:hypothetical protein KFL_003390130 [Klebsormidium nitens]|eukprot:GAQ87223.1 hypothetical protein KFL_003390130 [Klebsormidium nitens]